MKLLNVKGKLVDKVVHKYRINWSKQSRSQIQFKAKQLLKQVWEGDIVYEEFPVYGTLLKVDFFNATKRIAVEVNGEQHGEFHFFHNGSRMNYLESIKRDYEKRKWLELNKIKLVEVIKKEIDNTEKFFELLNA